MSRREEIHAAAFAALKRVPGVQLVERNRPHPPSEHDAPALLLYDGQDAGGDRAAKRRGAPQLVQCELQVYGYISAPSDTVGTEVNGLLAAVQKEVLDDDTLWSLTDDMGGVYMEAVKVAVAPARSAASGFEMTFSVVYPLYPQNP